MHVALLTLLLSQTPPSLIETPKPPPVLEEVFEWVRPYGLFKPTVIVSSGAVESFSQPNASAITGAGNPVLATQFSAPRTTFQVAQSRFGLWVREKGPVRGHLEIDFIDFTKATPTVASLPRLRIATVEWKASEHFTLQAGQDWDLHAPVNPHGNNLVGARFTAGNVGFMRQQVKAIGTVGALELAGAVGMEGVNTTARDAAFELSAVPTFAVRVSWLPGAHGRVGVSGLATSLRLGLGTPAERRALAGSAAAFADLTLGGTQLRAEFNLSQNINNLGMLGLSFGTAAHDVAEAGGFVSARQQLYGPLFLYGNVGLARALDPANVVPSYGYTALSTDGSPPALSSATLSGTGPGYLFNLGATLGLELRVNGMLSFLAEGFFLDTQHRLQAVDVGRVPSLRQAWGTEVAMVASF